MEFEHEMDCWGYNIQGGCEGSTKNVIVNIFVWDYKELQADTSNVHSFPYKYHQLDVPPRGGVVVPLNTYKYDTS